MPKFRSTLLAAALAIAFASGPAVGAVQQRVLLRRQPVRRRLVQAGAAAGHRPVHDQSGPVWAPVLGSRYGFTIIAGEPGRQRLRAGRRARDAAARLSARAADRARRCRSRRRSRSSSPRAVDGNAIYSVQGGANDIFTQFGLLQAGQITPAQLQANVGLAAAQLAQQVARPAGGRRALHRSSSTSPTSARRPTAAPSARLAAQITGIVQAVQHDAVTPDSTQVGGNVIRLNAFGLLNEILANPAAYGFANATAPACGATPSLLCTPANLVTPDAAQTYVFADGVHPTTAGQAIVAQYVAFDDRRRRSRWPRWREAPLAVEQANFRTLDGRMVASASARRAARASARPGPRTTTARHDYSTSFCRGDGDVNTIAVGRRHAGCRTSDR